jgi:hypothetical protein
VFHNFLFRGVWDNSEVAAWDESGTGGYVTLRARVLSMSFESNKASRPYLRMRVPNGQRVSIVGKLALYR